MQSQHTEDSRCFLHKNWEQKEHNVDIFQRKFERRYFRLY